MVSSMLVTATVWWARSKAMAQGQRPARPERPLPGTDRTRRRPLIGEVLHCPWLQPVTTFLRLQGHAYGGPGRPALAGIVQWAAGSTGDYVERSGSAVP